MWKLCECMGVNLVSPRKQMPVADADVGQAGRLGFSQSTLSMSSRSTGEVVNHITGVKPQEGVGDVRIDICNKSGDFAHFLFIHITWQEQSAGDD